MLSWSGLGISQYGGENWLVFKTSTDYDPSSRSQEESRSHLLECVMIQCRRMPGVCRKAYTQIGYNVAAGTLFEFGQQGGREALVVPLPHSTMPLTNPVRPNTTNLPSTLTKWRDYDTTPMISVWDPLRAWFSSEGLRVFDVMGSTTVKPPTNELRTHDGTFSTQYGPPNLVHEHRVRNHTSSRSLDINILCRDQSIVSLELKMDAMC